MHETAKPRQGGWMWRSVLEPGYFQAKFEVEIEVKVALAEFIAEQTSLFIS